MEKIDSMPITTWGVVGLKDTKRSLQPGEWQTNTPCRLRFVSYTPYTPYTSYPLYP